jgi:hypothetical protein
MQEERIVQILYGCSPRLVVGCFRIRVSSCYVTVITLLLIARRLANSTTVNPTEQIAFSETNNQEIPRKFLSSGTRSRVVRWKSTDVSEEHVASILRVEKLPALWEFQILHEIPCFFMEPRTFVTMHTRARYLTLYSILSRRSSPGRVKNFLLSTSSRLTLGSTQPPIQ